jgi:glycosyltransferase involved in cell wall biosynthesis
MCVVDAGFCGTAPFSHTSHEPRPAPRTGYGCRVRLAVVAEQLLAAVPGGTGRYTAGLVGGLLRTSAPDDSVAGWAAWHLDVTRVRSAVSEVHRLPLGRRALAAAWARGLGPVPRGELLHAPTPLMPPRRSRPVVVTVHDAVPWTHPETLTPHGVRWHRRMVGLAVRHADAITVPSAVVAAQLATVFPELDADRLHVLGAGVAPELLAEPDADRTAETRERLRLPQEYLVTVATLEPRKGLDVLIQALATLGSDAPTLVVVGQPGWGGVDLRATAAQAGLRPDLLQPVGRVSDADLGVVLRGAAALIAPSRAEGFGLPLAEAMALGVPVVCSDLPVFAEVAGEAALAVPVGDAEALASAIEVIGADAGLRDRLAGEGRMRAKAFDWDAVGRRGWALYRAVLDTARG